jgi:hypothetical protein
MKTKQEPAIIPAKLKSELQEALDNLGKRIRDPEAAKKASERMDRMREENRKLFGEQNIAVELIRETRERQ